MTHCTAVAPPPIPPTGFAVEAASLGDVGAALVGRTVLYCSLADGWQRGTVARLCPLGAFSHVAAYTPGGWCGPGPSTPGSPTPSLSLVGALSQLSARGREVNEHSHRMFC